MEITKQHIGHFVWHYRYGWGKIVAIGWTNYPVLVLFRMEGSRWYDTKGKIQGCDANQTLFWDEVKVPEPPKPKPNPDAMKKLGY